MKFAAILGMLAAIPAAAQSTPPASLDHGHRIAIWFAYLVDSPELQGEETGSIVVNGASSAVRLTTTTGDVILLTRGSVAGSLLVGGSSPETDGKIKAILRAENETPRAWFETWAEQHSSDYMESASSGFTNVNRMDGKVVLNRFVRDDLRHVYIRYAATVETLAGGVHRVSFGPSSDNAPEKLRDDKQWSLLTPAHFPVPQIVKDEDSVALELYTNGSTRRVVDYLRIGPQTRLPVRADTPHDYYADDAEFAVSHPAFRVNGEARDGVMLPDAIRGPALWVYVPGFGKFVLSFHAQPDAGFEDSGEVAGTSLMFSSKGNVIRIDAGERIAAGSGDYTIHVLSDPTWLPADPPDRERVMLGTAPGL